MAASTTSGPEEAPAPAPLLLMGRHFPLDFQGGELAVGGQALYISEEFNTGQGTGLTVWDGAVVLAKYLERAFPSGMAGEAVLELGCGTGVVGLAAAALGADSVTLTDLPYALENTAAVVAANAAVAKDRVTVAALDWTAPEPVPGVTLLLAADVVWVEELIPPLAATLCALTAPAGGREGLPSTVLLAHQTRSTRGDEALFALLTPHFALHAVPHEELHPDFTHPAITVFRLTRQKPQGPPS